MSSSKALFRSWFTAVRQGNMFAVQQIATAAEEGPTKLHSTVHAEVRGLDGLLQRRNGRGYTALHVAVSQGHTAVSVALIRLGANPHWRVHKTSIDDDGEKSEGKRETQQTQELQQKLSESLKEAEQNAAKKALKIVS